MKKIFAVLALVMTLTLHASSPASAQNAFKVTRVGNHAGHAMILIPGLLSSGDVWNGTVDRFKADYDMHVLTLAGFAGVAPLPASNASPFLATERDAIIKYIRDNKLDHPIIVGHSLGGFLALWIAATAPNEVGPIVAVDGVPYLAALGDSTMTPAKAAPQAEMMRNAFAGMTTTALGAQTRMAMTQQVSDSIWFTRGAEWGAASDGATAGRAIAEMLTTDIRADVARIKTPVLMFMSAFHMNSEAGEAALNAYRAQLRAVPDARVVVANDAHHFIMLDTPAFFYTTVASFLKGK